MVSDDIVLTASLPSVYRGDNKNWKDPSFTVFSWLILSTAVMQHI